MYSICIEKFEVTNGVIRSRTAAKKKKGMNRQHIIHVIDWRFANFWLEILL
jgi:hypothetical protein